MTIWWVGFRILGFEVIGGFLKSMSNNREFYGAEARSYLAALPWNLVQFVVFVGPVVAVVACRGLFGLIRQIDWARWSQIDRFQAVILGCLAVVFLSGGARGEVDRNWIVFMAPLAVVAACRIRNDTEWTRAAAVAGLHCLALAFMVEAIFAFV
jgi:hypothetical protein